MIANKSLSRLMAHVTPGRLLSLGFVLVALTGAHDGWLPFARLVTVAPMLSIRMVTWPAGASGLGTWTAGLLGAACGMGVETWTRRKRSS